MEDAAPSWEPTEGGNGQATAELLPLIYKELRRLAAYKMATEDPGHTLQPTALVHEAYLRLMRPNQRQYWQNKGHFFTAAAEAMRRILIESARRKTRLRHGGQLQRVDLEGLDLPLPMPDEQLLALNDALDELDTVDSRAAQVVKLCFFAGLTQPQAAKELGVSLATVERLWSFARAWLYARCKKANR